jgi:hypothetical protein
MKKVVFLLFLILSFVQSFGQVYTNTHNYGNGFTRGYFDSSVRVPVMLFPHMSTNLTGPGFITYNLPDTSLYIFDGTNWHKVGAGTNIDTSIIATRYYVDSSVAAIPSIDTNNTIVTVTRLNDSLYIPPFTVSSIPTIGETVPGGSAPFVINYLFHQTQPPTATLSGGTIVEMSPVSTIINETLSWTAGRQANTNPLSTIVVAGTNESFSQPAAPGTVSGTQGVTITANTNQTFTMTVTTTDSKTATSSTTYTFESKRYWGQCNTSSPTDAQILAAAGGGSEFSTTRAKSSFSIVITGTSQNFYYAYPASFGNLTSFVVGGFESIGAFTLTTRNLTNASGFTTSYNIYVSNNTFSNTTISGIVTN